MMPHQNDTLKMIFRKWFFQNDISKMILSKRFISKRKQNDTFWSRREQVHSLSSGKETTAFKTEHSFGFVGQNEGVVQKQIDETRNEELLFEKRWKQLFCFVETTWMWCKKRIDFYFEKTEFYGKWSFWRVQNDTFWNRPKWYFLKNVTAENSLKWCLAKMILFKKRYR